MASVTEEMQPGAPATSAPADSGLDIAREILYRFLSIALENPRYGRAPELYDPANRRLVAEAASLLREEHGAEVELAMHELPAEDMAAEGIFAKLDESPESLETRYSRLFGFIACKNCPPCETEYFQNGEVFFRAQQMADVAGFYRAFGIEPSRATPERPDHVALELGFLAFVLMKKRLARETGRPDQWEIADRCDEIEKKFLTDHVVWWMPAFSRLLREKDPNGYFGALGRFLAAFLAIERCRAGIAIPRRRAEPSEAIDPDEDDGCLVQIGP